MATSMNWERFICDTRLGLEHHKETKSGVRSDFERDCRMLELGVLGKDEFRAKWLNEDLKTSTKAIDEITSEAKL